MLEKDNGVVLSEITEVMQRARQKLEEADTIVLDNGTRARVPRRGEFKGEITLRENQAVRKAFSEVTEILENTGRLPKT